MTDVWLASALLETTWRKVVFSLVFLVFAGLTDKSHAEYLYLKNDSRVVHENLIADMQNGRMDLRNMSPTAQETLRRLSNSTMSSFPSVARLGKLKSVCHTLIVQFPKGSNLAFRANHENGTMDWVVTVSRDPEFVQNLAFLAIPTTRNVESGSGPPAILPPFVPGNGKLLPSVELDCREAFARSATDEEANMLCQRYPRMCS